VREGVEKKTEMDEKREMSQSVKQRKYTGKYQPIYINKYIYIYICKLFGEP